MKPIRMLRTQDGSPDGLTVLSYVKGQEYPAKGFPLSEFLRDVFLREGWAEEAGSPDPSTANVEPAASGHHPDVQAILERDAERMIAHPPAAVVPPDASPCAVTSPIGEACSVKGGHTEHEWIPLPPPKRRGRRTGGV